MVRADHVKISSLAFAKVGTPTMVLLRSGYITAIGLVPDMTFLVAGMGGVISPPGTARQCFVTDHGHLPRYETMGYSRLNGKISSASVGTGLPFTVAG